MELQNFPESFAALVDASDIIDCGEGLRLLDAVKAAGYWLNNAEHTDIYSGSVASLSTHQEHQEFAQRWADTIDTLVDEEYLDLEGLENLYDAYARYCQAAVLWAHSQLESKLQGAANISPSTLEELANCSQSAQELDEGAVWGNAAGDIAMAEALRELGGGPVEPSDVVAIWLADPDATVYQVQEASGAAAGLMLVGDGRALWFPDADHRYA